MNNHKLNCQMSAKGWSASIPPECTCDKEISECCKTIFHVEGSDEGTNHYECDKCGNACNVFIPEEEEQKGQAMECEKCHRTSVVVPLRDKCPFCQPPQHTECWAEEFDEIFPVFSHSGTYGIDKISNLINIKIRPKLISFFRTKIEEAEKRGNAKKGEANRIAYQRGYDEGAMEATNVSNETMKEQDKLSRQSAYQEIVGEIEKKVEWYSGSGNLPVRTVLTDLKSLLEDKMKKK